MSLAIINSKYVKLKFFYYIWLYRIDLSIFYINGEIFDMIILHGIFFILSIYKFCSDMHGEIILKLFVFMPFSICNLYAYIIILLLFFLKNDSCNN